MDFLNNLQKKYIPNIHKFRYDQRKANVNELRQKCHKNPQSLSYYELRLILQVLKHYKLLPKNQQHEALQKKFMFKATQNFFYAAAIGFSPFIFRQFFKFSTPKKFAIISILWLISYGGLMVKPLNQLNQFNRKLAQTNIHKFSIQLEED